MTADRTGTPTACRRTRRRLGAARARARGRGALRRPPAPGVTRCAETVAETRRPWPPWRPTCPPPKPSAELRDRLRAAVEETEQLPGPIPPPAAQCGPARGARCGPGARWPVPRPDARARQRWRRSGAPAAWSPRASRPVIGLGLWNVDLSTDRRELEASLASQNAAMHVLLDPHRATLAPLGDSDGQPVVTVVPHGHFVEVVAHGLPANDAERRTSSSSGACRGHTPGAARHVRRDGVSDGAANRRLRADRFRPVRRLRRQPRTRSGGSVAADGGRRDRAGDQLSDQETVAAPGRPAAAGERDERRAR